MLITILMKGLLGAFVGGVSCAIVIYFGHRKGRKMREQGITE